MPITLEPDPLSLQPVKVYSQDYSKLWGVGKYATFFSQGTASADMFGDGRDGNLTVTTGQIVTINTVKVNVTASGLSAAPVNSIGFSVGDTVLFHQSQKTANVGRWELNQIVSINSASSWTLAKSLVYSYDNTGGVAQVIRVPQYHNLTVQGGGTLTVPGWDGNTGGIMGFLANGTFTNNGTVTATGKGFRGAAAIVGKPGRQGEGVSGVGGTQNNEANGNGGGGGGHNNGTINGGGGGGGNGTIGGYGSTDQGLGYSGTPGNPSGSSDLTTITFGGGGGSGGSGTSVNGGSNGGGILFLFAAAFTNNSTITNSGVAGLGSSEAGGGGGAGGSVLLKFQTGTLGSITAIGGSGGDGTYVNGGAGAVGRIHVEYCNTFSGSTNPPVDIKPLNCYIAEQQEVVPYTTTRLKLPESFSNSQTYQVLYGRMLTFLESGTQISQLRLPAGLLAIANLDSLITWVGPGILNFSLDIGNDGTWDWVSGASTNYPTLNSPNLSAAFNAYWSSHGAPSTGTIDVPIRVYMDKPGQVLLTNLQVTPGGSKLRSIRLKAGNYSNVTLNYTLSGGSGAVTAALDVGDDGLIDNTWSGNPASYPVAHVSGNLATEINAYLAGKTGEIDIPIRFFIAPDHALALASFSATFSGQPDLTLSPVDISQPGSPPVESDLVPLTATIHNTGGVASGGLAVSFFATPPGGQPWFIGSTFLSGVSDAGSATASIEWNTLGFSGDVPVQVVIDPLNRVAEGIETNNQASTSVTIKTRADLTVNNLDQPEADLAVTQAGKINISLDNIGQSDASASIVALYDGNPSSGGVLIGQQSVAAVATSQTPINFDWTPSVPGQHRLFVVADLDGVVNEADKSNNTIWKDVYVGLKSPLMLDSGAASDEAYTFAQGYGYVDTGLPDVLTTCGAGSLAEETLRRDPDGQVRYQFDNLAPNHAYHLDLVLFECDGAGRQESVLVDTYRVAGPIDLGDGQVHHLSILVDPALYMDRKLVVDINSPGIDGAVIGAINLFDVDYRYIDAGSTSDTTYTVGKGSGWLDGQSIASTAWGKLPYQSVRVDQSDSDLSYRFDRLKAGGSYRVHLTFWQKDGAARIHKVWVEGVDTNLAINTGDYQVHQASFLVPVSAYALDGSITVRIERLGAFGATVNEISLEEETISQTSALGLTPTPYFTDVYGSVLSNVVSGGMGSPALVGTVIQAVSPRGDIVGIFTVTTEGQYGYMRVYGEDIAVSPSVAGMRDGELVTFLVNGAPAVAKPSFYWHDDNQVHQVDLSAGNINQQQILLSPGWNFISFSMEPPSPLTTNVLSSILNRYDRVLGESGVYIPNLPDYVNTLKEMHVGPGYYIHVTGTSSVNLLVDGLSQASDVPIPLHQGWNWIGYTPSTSIPIADALAGIAGHYQLVHSADKTYNPTDLLHSTLLTLEPGQGYMIYMDSDLVLQYPHQTSTQSVTTSETGASLAVSPTPWMTIIYGDVNINGRSAPVGTRIDVLTPRGEVAGSCIVSQGGVIQYTHVYGVDKDEQGGFHEGETMEFRVNGFLVEAVPGMTWSSDLSLHAVQLDLTIQTIFLPGIFR